MKIIRHPLFMRPTPESELEQAVDGELRRLPNRRAPATLLPRVLQAIAERERRPWWQKSVSYWPWPARGLFLVATSGLAGLLLYFTWGVSSGISLGALASEVGEVTQRFESVRAICGSLIGAVVLVVRSAGPWLLWAAAGVLMASYLTTLALGTYCYRLVSERI